MIPSSRRGFTVIELLVAIVIVAILAAISIVAYRGIVERAKSAQVVANMDGWAKSLTVLATTDSPWPGASNDFICLGRSGDYPADATFPANSCVKFVYDSGTVYNYLYDEANFAAWPATVTRPSGQSTQTKFRQNGATVTVYARGFLGVRMPGPPETYTIMYYPQTQGACGKGWTNSPNTVGSLEGEGCTFTIKR